MTTIEELRHKLKHIAPNWQKSKLAFNILAIDNTIAGGLSHGALHEISGHAASLVAAYIAGQSNQTIL